MKRTEDNVNGYVAKWRGLFYAVTYEGLDPITGRERRRWYPAGTDRVQAQRLAAQLGVAWDGGFELEVNCPNLDFDIDASAETVEEAGASD